jgi:UDP-3-O-[3-hydroxymyristoyl] glucosamine N-acyltransferase
MPAFTAAELAERLQGRVVGDPAVRLTGFAPADNAGPGDLTWAENPKHLARAETSAAAAILLAADVISRKTLIRVPNARIAFARVLPWFYPEPVFPAGIHPTAVVAASASVDATAHVGPLCVVGERAQIGARVVLMAGDYVGEGCRLGEDTRLFPGVTLYAGTQVGKRVRLHAGVVVGSDGFGYVLDGGAHRKIPQVGHVVIEDDVELGANVTVDRGALGATVIGRGTKVDNLVQIGHNVVVGQHCILVAQAGVAGSARLGNYVTIAGQAGVVGHLTVGDRAVIAGQSGVIQNVPAGQVWFGSPARPATQMKRQMVLMERLPELVRRVAELEKELAALKAGSSVPAA